MLTITHALVASDPQSPRIGATEWNDEHSVAGDLGGVSESLNNITTATTLQASDTGKIYTNTGAASVVEVDLPTSGDGLSFTFLVTDTSGYQITGAGAIQVGGSSANTFTCTQLGGALTIYGYSGGWIASSVVRTWIDS